MYSIVIVNYKAGQLVIDCLSSMAADFRKQNDIIVVDNASDDGIESKLKMNFPEVNFIQAGYNSGFSRANNMGIRAAKGDCVLLLNSDTLDIDSNIKKCFHRFEHDVHAVACGVQLLNMDNSPQISGSYFMKGGLNFLMSVPYLGFLIRRVGLWLQVKNTSVKEASDIVEVDWLNGAFLMFKKAAVEKVGWMDEDFFLYSEEIEWCSRIHTIGKLFVYGDLNVYHLEGGSSKKAFESDTRGYQNLTDKKGFQLLVSHLLRMRKQYGIAWLMFHFLFFLAAIPIFWVIALFSFNGKVWKNCVGYSANIFNSIPYLFRIIKSKPFFYKVL